MDKKRISAKLTDNGGAVETVAPPPSLPADLADAPTYLPVPRDEKGRFLKGNREGGRPKGSTNHLTQMRRDLEMAMRGYLDHPRNRMNAMLAIDRLMNICISGDEKNAVGALKLLLDKLMVSPRPEEEQAAAPTAVTIIVDNKTLDHQPAVEVIDLPPKDYEETS